jgi:hypothetical protein
MVVLPDIGADPMVEPPIPAPMVGSAIDEELIAPPLIDSPLIEEGVVVVLEPDVAMAGADGFICAMIESHADFCWSGVIP